MPLNEVCMVARYTENILFFYLVGLRDWSKDRFALLGISNESWKGPANANKFCAIKDPL